MQLFLHKIIDCRDFLNEYKHNDEYVILAKALTHFIDSIDNIEQFIPSECHFAKHFEELFSKDEIVIEDCYTLYEDLVMIFRAKILQVGKENMEDAELELLKNYEDNLKFDDCNSLLATWYFLKLPALLNKSEYEKHYVGSGWKRWWTVQMQNI